MRTMRTGVQAEARRLPGVPASEWIAAVMEMIEEDIETEAQLAKVLEAGWQAAGEVEAKRRRAGRR